MGVVRKERVTLALGKDLMEANIFELGLKWGWNLLIEDWWEGILP